MAAPVFAGFMLVMIITGRTTEVLPIENYSTMQMCEEAAGGSVFYDSSAKQWDQATKHNIQFVCVPTTRASSASKSGGG